MGDHEKDPPAKIEHLYAFVMADMDGDEGLIAIMTPYGFMPAVGADLTRIEQLRPMVQDVANHLQRAVHLRFFETMRELETIYPDLPAQGKAPS